tara:strand:- start:276 stop:506 length:231 start_codon:yes stop_codon:yes gene_type:complete
MTIEVKLLRETANNDIYGVLIPNYAADQVAFKIFETNDIARAKACADCLERNNITDRAAYNKSPIKTKLVRTGCEI